MQAGKIWRASLFDKFEILQTVNLCEDINAWVVVTDEARRQGSVCWMRHLVCCLRNWMASCLWFWGTSIRKVNWNGNWPRTFLHSRFVWVVWNKDRMRILESWVILWAGSFDWDGCLCGRKSENSRPFIFNETLCKVLPRTNCIQVWNGLSRTAARRWRAVEHTQHALSYRTDSAYAF